MDVTVVDHPLAAERLTILRDATTANAEFRQALDGLAGMLIYEATRDLPATAIEVRTPLGPAAGRRLAGVPMLVPILRAGVGHGERGAAARPPSRGRASSGLARNEETFQPHALPGQAARAARRPPDVRARPDAGHRRLARVYTCRLLVERGAPAADHRRVRAGRARGPRAHRPSPGIDVRIVTASIDSHLNELAYIVPGLGDAGDRQFGLW